MLLGTNALSTCTKSATLSSSAQGADSGGFGSGCLTSMLDVSISFAHVFAGMTLLFYVVKWQPTSSSSVHVTIQ